jgi:hypothetical protein
MEEADEHAQKVTAEESAEEITLPMMKFLRLSLTSFRIRNDMMYYRSLLFVVL